MRSLPEFDSDSDVIDADDSYHSDDKNPPHPPTAPILITTSSTIDPDVDCDKSIRDKTATESKYEWHMELASILLFILGSVLYLVCAVNDYQWSQTLLTLPEWLRGVDDDALWMRYRLEEKYGDVSSISVPSGRRLTLGGVRRRLMREHYWKNADERIDEYIENLGAKTFSRNLQQTPEELYYDLDWECLPAEIQAAYAVLSYDQNSWDNEIEVDTDTMDWAELTPEQQEAALFIGYTEFIWCEYDDAFVIESAWDDTVSTVAADPILPPTQNPTFKPTGRPITESPTDSFTPTVSKTNQPSAAASESPSSEPSGSPKPTLSDFIMGADGSMIPRPTEQPTVDPSATPTLSPSIKPSSTPSEQLSVSPSAASSHAPSISPSESSIVLETGILSSDELYGDEWWHDLPPEIQAAFAILGWNETGWDESINPPSETMDWVELTPEMQDAASAIGYTEDSWDTEDESVDYDLTNSTQASSNGTAVIADENLTPDADYYEDYDWVELPSSVMEAAITLGWSQSLWDSGGTAWSDELFWDELPPDAQEAAAVFGYNEVTWNADGDTNLESLLVAAGGQYISNDDDYVFEVGSSNIQVSEYQLLYLFASLAFVFTGMIDLVREKKTFHLLMILAGAFGVASAVFVEEDIHLSNILDCISVHLFLLEGFALLSNDRKRELMEQGDLARRLIVFADSQFLLGAIIDVALSYFYLFDETADWDTALVLTWLFSAILWVSCSLIYLGVFVYENS